MSLETMLLTTVQEVYFDLCDLDNNNELKNIKVKGFEEFKNLRDLIDEQINKLNYLEKHLTTYFKLEDENA
jgi:hypothetical protein